MALTNYATLQTAITAHAWRTGSAQFTALVPDLITLVEQRVNDTLRVAQMETTATVTLTDGSGSLPADYLEHRRVVANVSPPMALEMVSPDYATDRYPENEAGYPRYFTIIGSTIKTYPSSTGDLALTYYAKIPALSVSNTTNWLLTRAPGIYLYGALLEGIAYLQDTTMATVWEGKFQQAMTGLQNADTGARYARAVSRVSGPTP